MLLADTVLTGQAAAGPEVFLLPLSSRQGDALQEAKQGLCVSMHLEAQVRHVLAALPLDRRALGAAIPPPAHPASSGRTAAHPRCTGTGSCCAAAGSACCACKGMKAEEVSWACRQ